MWLPVRPQKHLQSAPLVMATNPESVAAAMARQQGAAAMEHPPAAAAMAGIVKKGAIEAVTEEATEVSVAEASAQIALSAPNESAQPSNKPAKPRKTPAPRWQPSSQAHAAKP